MLRRSWTRLLWSWRCASSLMLSMPEQCVQSVVSYCKSLVQCCDTLRATNTLRKKALICSCTAGFAKNKLSGVHFRAVQVRACLEDVWNIGLINRNVGGRILRSHSRSCSNTSSCSLLCNMVFILMFGFILNLAARICLKILLASHSATMFSVGQCYERELFIFGV